MYHNNARAPPLAANPGRVQPHDPIHHGRFRSKSLRWRRGGKNGFVDAKQERQLQIGGCARDHRPTSTSSSTAESPQRSDCNPPKSAAVRSGNPASRDGNASARFSATIHLFPNGRMDCGLLGFDKAPTSRCFQPSIHPKVAQCSSQLFAVGLLSAEAIVWQNF